MRVTLWPPDDGPRENGRVRLMGEVQHKRDELVLELFRGGVPYRTTGKRVDMSLGGAHKVVCRMLAAPRSRRATRNSLSRNALDGFGFESEFLR
jgi:hypothetical protein